MSKWGSSDMSLQRTALVSNLSKSKVSAKQQKLLDQINDTKHTQAIAEEKAAVEAALAMLELSRGYRDSTAGEPLISDTRGSLMIDVDNEDFSAALALLQMQRQGEYVGTAQVEKAKPVSRAASRLAPEPTGLGRSSRVRDVKLGNTPAPIPVPASHPGSDVIPPLNLDTSEGFLPSAASSYAFKYDSPSSTLAADLDKILKPSGRPKRFPLDLKAEKTSIVKSYTQLGTKPETGLASRLVQDMEDRWQVCARDDNADEDVEMGDL